jgi:uncharacterized protein (TIGR02271 family)
LTGLGAPEADADFFRQQADAGRPIVAVLAAARQQEAFDLLAGCGGYGSRTPAGLAAAGSSAAGRAVETAAPPIGKDVVTDTDTGYGSQTAAGQTAAASWAAESGAQTPAPRAGEEVLTDTEETRRLRLREEQLRVEKQAVQTGEVRLGKEVVTEQQTITVPTTHEEVYIERRPGSGQPADQPIGEGETIEVPVSEERLTVEKQPVVREEVTLGKRQVQENQQVTDTVRREEARLEREGDVNVQGNLGETRSTDRDTTA